MFQVQARNERFNVWRSLMDCKLKEGDPLSPRVIKMMGYMQALDLLGHPLTPELATDTILGSLPPRYNSFITNFHMPGMEKKPIELHGMLKIAEQDIKKGTHQVLMVQNKAKFKKSWSKKNANAKGKDKDVILNPSPTPKPGPDAKTICFYYKENGHWKRNCNKWLTNKVKSSGSTTSTGTLVIYVIDIYLAD